MLHENYTTLLPRSLYLNIIIMELYFEKYTNHIKV